MVKGDRGYQESGLLYFYLDAWLPEIKHFQATSGTFKQEGDQNMQRGVSI